MSPGSPPPSRDEELIAAAVRQVASRRPSRSHGSNDVTLDSRTGAAGRRETPNSEVAARLGAAGYELIAERHRGGQGIVFEALQRSTKRKVAVKVLYEGPLTGVAARRRFEREIEILGQLRHPNVVTVHDSGEAGGRAFYVMDLVAGEPLDRWAASRRYRLPVGGSARQTLHGFVNDTLRMFVKICDAVNAAHLRGVIHRDLKPGNILIDSTGEPRVLDFGLAKFAPGPPDDASAVTAMTTTGQFVGSLPWSSPEQVSRAPTAVDLRADVYAIGVLLYHTLTGQFPYCVTGSAAETLEQIRTAEPQRINDGLRGGGDSTARATRVNEEVEIIVARCLQKDPSRRYQSAGDLGRDIQRYLLGEPIEAKRDSLAYLLRQRLRRYWLPVSAVAAVALASLGGGAMSLVFWQRAEAERRAARAAEQTAVDRQHEAESVAALLESLLASANPLERAEHNYTVRELLDEFNARLGESLVDQPLLAARLHSVIGNAYRQLGEFAPAEQHLRAAFDLYEKYTGDESESTARGWMWLGYLARDRDDYTHAGDCFRRSLALLERVHGGAGEAYIQSLNALGELHMQAGQVAEAERLLQRAVDMARTQLGDQNPLLASCLHNLASVRDDQRDLLAAEALYREALDVYRRVHGEAHPDVAVSEVDLSLTLVRARRFDEAGTLLDAARRTTEQSYGPRHYKVGGIMSRQAELAMRSGQFDEAERLAREALEILRPESGARSLSLADDLNTLGLILMNKGDMPGAIEAFQESIAMLRDLGTPSPPVLASTTSNLAQALYRNGDPAAAEPLLRESAEIDRRHFGAQSAQYVDDLRGLAHVLDALERLSEAADVVRAVIEVQAASLPDADAALVANRSWLAGLLARDGARLIAGQNFASATERLRESLRLREQVLPAGDWLIANTRSLLGAALAGLGQDEEAERLLVYGCNGLKAATPPAERMQEAIQRLVDFYARRGQTTRADEWRRQLAP